MYFFLGTRYSKNRRIVSGSPEDPAAGIDEITDAVRVSFQTLGKYVKSFHRPVGNASEHISFSAILFILNVTERIDDCLFVGIQSFCNFPEHSQIRRAILFNDLFQFN